MERSRVVAVVLAGCVAGGAAVAKADFVIPKPKRPGPNAKIGLDALRVVGRRGHGCAPRLRPLQTTPTHAPPTARSSTWSSRLGQDEVQVAELVPEVAGLERGGV